MKMNLTDERVNELYKEYLNQRNRTEKYIKKHGGEMRDTVESSKSDFLLDLKSARFDDRKSSYKTLAKKLAKDELYPTSSPKAIGAAKAHAKMYGVEYSPGLVSAYRMNVAYQGEVIWDDISTAYKSLRDEGLSGTTAKKMIATQFFGGRPK